jgi:hypothetical protein
VRVPWAASCLQSQLHRHLCKSKSTVLCLVHGCRVQREVTASPDPLHPAKRSTACRCLRAATPTRTAPRCNEIGRGAADDVPWHQQCVSSCCWLMRTFQCRPTKRKLQHVTLVTCSRLFRAEPPAGDGGRLGRAQAARAAGWVQVAASRQSGTLLCAQPADMSARFLSLQCTTSRCPSARPTPTTSSRCTDLPSACRADHCGSRHYHWPRVHGPAVRAVQIYRNFEIGKLIKLIMLDTRIIGRSPQNASLAAVNVRIPGSSPCHAEVEL